MSSINLKPFLKNIRFEVKSEIYDDIANAVAKGDKDLKDFVDRASRGLKHTDFSIKHFPGDDEVRCKCKDGKFFCEHKGEDGWKKINKHALDSVRFIKYVSRPPEKFEYGLHCKYLDDSKTVDCNYIRKDRLKEPKNMPDNIKWDGPPGFDFVECINPLDSGDFLQCDGSVEKILGLESKVEEKFVYDDAKEEWIPKRDTVKEHAYVDEKKFNQFNISKKGKVDGKYKEDEAVLGKMVSLTTEQEPDLDGITTLEVTEKEHRGTKKNPNRLIIVSGTLEGKPFKADEPESLHWTDDEEYASFIGQGDGHHRHKSEFDEDWFL